MVQVALYSSESFKVLLNCGVPLRYVPAHTESWVRTSSLAKHEADKGETLNPCSNCRPRIRMTSTLKIQASTNKLLFTAPIVEQRPAPRPSSYNGPQKTLF